MRDTVVTAEEGDQQLIDHFPLTDDHLADLIPQFGIRRRETANGLSLFLASIGFDVSGRIHFRWQRFRHSWASDRK
jgi:hypothetical protein